MRAKKQPVIPVQRDAGRKQKYFFKRNNHNKSTGNFKRKTRSNRHPEKRRKEADLLALFGLAFWQVPKITFFRLDRIGGHHGR